MSIANRIQNLRKSKGFSQEDLANKMNVSRQSVSKWESEQSFPDIDKIILMSEIFEVTTDYLLKGVEINAKKAKEETKFRKDARIFTIVSTAFNFVGLLSSIIIWLQRQDSVAVAIGLTLMAIGSAIFAVGQVIGENKKIAAFYFVIINIWILSFIPISCIFNVVQGVISGFNSRLSPIPLLENSLFLYALCYLFYIAICVTVDILYIKLKKRKK